MGWLGAYWRWIGSNVGAMPAEAAVAFVAGIVFRKPLGRLIRWLRAEWADETREALTEVRELAEKAHRIAADTFEHHTGTAHPDAARRPHHDAEGR